MPAPGIQCHPCCCSSMRPRAIQPRSIFTRYLRSTKVSATASHGDLLPSARGGDGFLSGLGNELFQGALRSLLRGDRKTALRYGREILPGFSSGERSPPQLCPEDCSVCCSANFHWDPSGPGPAGWQQGRSQPSIVAARPPAPRHAAQKL